MKKIMLIFFGIISLFVSTVHATVIHRETSLYQTIEVQEQPDVRCLQFATAQQRLKHYQGCIYTTPKKRHHMYFNYSKALMAPLLLNPSPKRILVIGLGAGVLPLALRETISNAFIETVEIDPAVVDIAKRYFGYRDDARLKTYVTDGRVFVKRALEKHIKYDLVILDAFNGDYIPEHLMTADFLHEVKGILSHDGLLAANTFARSQLYHHESETYHRVWGDFYNLKMDGNRANRVILAAKQGLPPQAHIRSNALQWAKHFYSRYAINVNELLTHMDSDKDWDITADVLTDEYSPANLLKAHNSPLRTAGREYLALLEESLTQFPIVTCLFMILALLGAVSVITLMIGLLERRIKHTTQHHEA